MEREHSPIEKTNQLLKELSLEMSSIKELKSDIIAELKTHYSNQITPAQYIKLQDQYIDLLTEFNMLKTTIEGMKEPTKQQSTHVVPVTSGTYFEKAKAAVSLPDPPTETGKYKTKKKNINDPWENLKIEPQDPLIKNVYSMITMYYEKYTENDGIYIDDNGKVLTTYNFHTKINNHLQSENLEEIVKRGDNGYNYQQLNTIMRKIMSNLGFETVQVPSDDGDRKIFAYKGIAPTSTL